MFSVMDRRTFLAIVGGGLAVMPLFARAQQPAKLPRVGYLSPSSAPSHADGLLAGLNDYGYAEGKNIVIEFRWANQHYDRIPVLARDLVRLKVDIIVTGGTQATIAAKNATTIIPIVMTNTGDAVSTGLVTSLARPGGNVTGLTALSPPLIAKRLELVKEILPGVRVVAVILNPANPAQALSFKALAQTAKSLGVDLQVFTPRAASELPETFAAMARQRVEALMTTNDSLIDAHAAEIADLAAKMRIPTAGNSALADAGGLLGYGANTFDTYRRVGSYVDRILKGAKPADLPVEQPAKFEFVINLKTAKSLGITIPRTLLLRADRVIE